MTIDATFWVAISFIIFCVGLIYLKVPKKINELKKWGKLLHNIVKSFKNKHCQEDKFVRKKDKIEGTPLKLLGSGDFQ